MRRVLALAITLFAASAHGGELPRDPMVQLLIRGESAPIEMGSDYLFGLTEATLADKAASTGATVRSDGRGEYSVACASRDGRAVWLLSDASDYDGEPLLTAMINTPSPNEVACDPVAELEPGPSDEDVPGVGASAADIATRFGTAEISENGLVAFRSHDMAGDGGNSWELIKTVTYHLTDDLVDAVAYEVVTVR